MTIHKEGATTLILSFFILTIVNLFFYNFFPNAFWNAFIAGASLVIFIFLLSFFRKPDRKINQSKDDQILSPCDGKIVVIENVFESEFLQKECKMVSIFMSPLNVHINWYPISGTILYSRYHPGKYLAAWNPKASTENERTSIAIGFNNDKLLLRQVAGALARRIVSYAQENQEVVQGEELGFIKFGSRVDLYLPLNAEVSVKLNDVVTGNRTVIAAFNN